MEFRWNRWNVEHIGRHGVTPEEAEQVVASARKPYPMHRKDGRWLAWGRTPWGRWLQVAYVLDGADRVFVIHARPLTENERRRARRRRPS